jgi:hypothetical protein
MSGFDVFEIMDDGKVMWHRATSDLGEAEKLAREQAAKRRAIFFILDQSSQKKLFVDANGTRREGDFSDVPPPLKSTAT